MNLTLNLLRDLPRNGPASAPVARLPVAHVQSAVDPRVPGRVAYLIIAPTWDIVQAELDRLCAQCDAAPGNASALCSGPHRTADGYEGGAYVTMPVTK